MMNEESAADFEAVAKKSWQSFSTMKRFVSEATRLENASWRLWFMQRRRLAAGAAPPASQPADDEDEHERHGTGAMCIYCEIHRASLSCNGCCHDAYCVSCFKLVHKKGNLATHTAVKIRGKSLSRAGSEREGISQHNSTTATAASDDSDAPAASPEADTPSSGEAPSAAGARPTKPWELQMDILLQRLMMNSFHSETDISVHNIDRRDSLGTADSVTSFMSDDDMDVDVEELAKPSPHHALSSSSVADEEVVANAVAVAGRHRKHTLSFDDGRMGAMPSTDAALPADFGDNPPTSPMFPHGLPRTNSRKKNSLCANCNGNHITINCPLLENSLLSGPSSSSQGAGGSSIDTVLRKCFTTIHNNNLSNSTHAFLGDEVSVRGGGNFFAPSASDKNKRRLSFGIAPIVEDADDEAHSDATPVLVELAPSEDDGHAWAASSWLLSCLATDLPPDVFEALKTTGRHLKSDSPEDSEPCDISGWAHIKEPGRQWSKRFLSLYRNNLWEYVNDEPSSRPIGHANVFEGSVHLQQRSTIEFVLKYHRQSSPNSPRNELWLRFDSPTDAERWRTELTRATKLNIDDLFDLAPSSPTSSPNTYELGKGRFSIVRRARRRRTPGSISSSSTLDCALKIVDKNVFWDLVARDTERDDTVIREILTQSLLTVRAGDAYCPVIRLQSLFETRDLLVMELELMKNGDLHEEIATHSAVDETEAALLIASLVRAVAYCLQNGVAHRDVKLSNLALDCSVNPKGRKSSLIKMADFGMAAFIHADGTLTGRCGTPGFVAPEILSAGKGEAYPSGVDMFSVGVVAYTMLCGYEPFFGVNDEELIQMNKRVEYEFEEPEWSSISDEAKDLITLMMEKDVAKRISPAEALAHPFLCDANMQLDELLAATTGPSHPVRLL